MDGRWGPEDFPVELVVVGSVDGQLNYKVSKTRRRAMGIKQRKKKRRVVSAALRDKGFKGIGRFGVTSRNGFLRTLRFKVR